VFGGGGGVRDKTGQTRLFLGHGNRLNFCVWRGVGGGGDLREFCARAVQLIFQLLPEGRRRT
jgi:hypothetical protein